MSVGTCLHVSHCIVTTCLLIAMPAMPAQAVQLQVPGQYGTIQAGIDAAVAGDEVVLAPGTYTGDGNRDLDYHGKAITVRGSSPANPAVAAATIIDCQGSEDSPHRGVRFHSGEGPEAALEGLTIQNGFAPLEQVQNVTNSFGGGIFINGASPTIRYCVVRNNKTGSYGPQSNGVLGGDGAGIYCANSTLTLEFCQITGNVAGKGQIRVVGEDPVPQGSGFRQIGGLGGRGGGIGCLYSSVTVRGCAIADNTAGPGGFSYSASGWDEYYAFSDGAHGGGIWAAESSLDVFDSAISGNLAGHGAHVPFEHSRYQGGNGGDGGGIHCATSWLTLTNCRIEGNRSGYGGSGRCEGGSGGHGGGVYCGFAEIRNCLIAGNQASDGAHGEYGGEPAGGHGGGIYSSGELTISGCTIVSNKAGNGGRVQEPSPGVGGNGGGVCASLLSMSNCIVAGNSAGNGGGLETLYSAIDGADGGNGGGVFCEAGMMQYCLFANNAAGDGGSGDEYTGKRSSGGDGGDGGAIRGGTARYCTFANNRAGLGGKGYDGGVDGTAGTGNDISYGSTAGCTFLSTGGAAYEVGFVDADGPDDKTTTWQDNNHHLAKGSPCINAGESAYVPNTGETDMDGQPRVAYGRVDMGADEFLLAGDVDGNGTVNAGDLQVLVAAWGSARTEGGSWHPDADVNHDGYVNIGDLQLMIACWGRQMSN